jgi:hypothetical protein
VLVRVEGGRAVCTDLDGAEVRGPRGLGPALSATPVLLDAELVGEDLWIGDLLHLDGSDRRDLPWRERHALLEGLGLQGVHWRPAPVFPGGGEEVVAAVAAQGLPGVVAKDPDAPYGAGWVAVTTGPAPVRVPVPTRDPRVGRARLTNPGKVLYPLTGTTKADVLAHYRAVAPAMLPHLRDRPVTLVRWPDGVERGSFFEKDVSRHAPDWIRTARGRHARRPVGDRGLPGAGRRGGPGVGGQPGRAGAARAAVAPRTGRREAAARPRRVRPRPRRGHHGGRLRADRAAAGRALSSTTGWSPTRARRAARGCSSTCRSR